MGEGEVVCGGEQALEWKVGKRYTGDNPKGCQPRNNMGAAWTPIAHMGHSMHSINGGGAQCDTRDHSSAPCIDHDRWYELYEAVNSELAGGGQGAGRILPAVSLLGLYLPRSGE